MPRRRMLRCAARGVRQTSLFLRAEPMRICCRNLRCIDALSKQLKKCFAQSVDGSFWPYIMRGFVAAEQRSKRENRSLKTNSR